MSADIVRREETDIAPELRDAFLRMGDMMRSMADMLRTTNERMDAMEKQIRLLTKVTPMQATAIGKAVSNKAQTLAIEYQMPGLENKIAAMIRKDIKLRTGAGSMREIPRCEYEVTMESIAIWNDFDRLMELRGR